MPTRRTSPRRTATRPSGLHERPPSPIRDDDFDEPRAGFLADAAPWLALLAVVLAAGALGFAVLGGGGDLTACRTAAWSAIPKSNDLPADWTLGSTDLNANGMTISILGPIPADASANQPVVYASVTCYGDAAAAALAANKTAADSASSIVRDRTSAGDAYDVENPQTNSVTTLFRVGGLVGQVADAGTASPSELDAITVALATAMGDEAAAGKPEIAAPDDSSPDPLGSDDVGVVEPSASPFAPELEALLPTSIADSTSTASPPATIALTIESTPASEIFGGEPSSRALAARVRAMGSTFDQLQVAQAYDGSGALDLQIIAFRLPRADLAKLRLAILETWLSADAEGVTTSTVTLGGKEVTKVDYGDDQTIEYVYAIDDSVIVIDTSDIEIATAVAEQLK